MTADDDDVTHSDEMVDDDHELTRLDSAGAARVVDSEAIVRPVPSAVERGSRWTIGSGVRASVREFFVIVAGVLAALGAQAVWEDYQERELERDYLEQLVFDARENERRLNEAIATDSVGVAAAARLMIALELDTPGVSQDSMAQWIFTLGSAPDFQPVTGTHRALLETGVLRFVRDAQLRQVLTTYATSLDRGTSRLEQLRASTLATVPVLAREIPFMRLVFSRRPDISTLDVAALQRNENAATAFFTMQALAENRLNGLRSMRAATLDLLDALGATAIPDAADTLDAIDALDVPE